MDISRYLVRGQENYDKSVFEKWSLGIISTNKAIELFKKNNKISDNITVGEFETWLRSLGWRKADE